MPRTTVGESVIPLTPVILALGSTSIVAQIVLLREFQGAYTGNELTLGIVLAAWMLLSGAGALAGRRLKRDTFTDDLILPAVLILAIVPFLTLLLIRVLRNIVFTPGSMITIAEATVSSLVLLSPYCILSGFSFAFLARARSVREGSNPVAIVYAWESVGSAAGGILAVIALATLLDATRVLLLQLLIDVMLVMFIALRVRRRVLCAAASVLAFSALAVGISGGLDVFSRSLLFPGQEILTSVDTPYGNLTVTRQGDQRNVFENMLLYCSTGDVTTDEENVHYGMVQRPSPQQVLMIGGGITGMAGEILKYGVQRVDCVEINPWLIEVGQRMMQISHDPRVRFVNEDARRFVETTPERYDAILINLPEPGTAQINRLYTEEFYLHVAGIMNEGAVLATSVLPAAEYQGTEARALNSILVATLHSAFPEVIIIPGQRQYFVASDRPLDTHIGRLIQQREIATVYVNPYYIDDELLTRRSAEISSSLDGAAAVNTDFHPVSYYRQIRYWSSYFGFNPLWFLLPLGGIVLLVLPRRSIAGIGVFVGGVSASSLEIVLLIAFQIFCGSMYQMIGILITTFMVGIAAGAAIARAGLRRAGLMSFSAVQFAIAVVSIALPSILMILRDSKPSTGVLEAIFPGLALVIAVLVGILFAVASSVRQGAPTVVASELYGLDLLGSAVGALAVSAFAIPLLGVLNTCHILAVISAAGSLISLIGWLMRPLRPAVQVAE